MRVLTYQIDDRERLGILSDDEQWIYPVEAIGMEYRDMKELIREISDSEIQLAEHIAGKQPYEAEIRGATPLEDVRLLAPIPNPEQDIICLGVNYMDHLKESSDFLKGAYKEEQEYAVYFGKRVNRASGDKETIPSYPGLVDGLDYEAELAVIIGKDAKDVPEEKAGEYIFGYTILNDISAMDNGTLVRVWMDLPRWDRGS